MLTIPQEKRFEIREQTTFDDFESVLKSDPRTAQYDRETTTALFDKLREKIVKRLEDDRHQQERHARRKMDALRSAMKHLDPAIDINDTWEHVRPRIQKLEEFAALETEDLRRTAFEKFIRRLKEKHDDREKERERKEKDRKERSYRETAVETRNGHRGSTGYHKPTESRHHRDHHASRSPEPDAYEAERRRAAGERERQYQHRGSTARSTSHHRSERGEARRPESRHRHDRDRGENAYDRERREREEERERQYRSRGDDEYRTRRRARPLSPTEESEDGRRDSKVRCPPC